jgi:hypothetical protein
MRRIWIFVFFLISLGANAQPMQYGYGGIFLEMNRPNVVDVLKEMGLEWEEVRSSDRYLIAVPENIMDREFFSKPCVGPQDCVRMTITFNEPPVGPEGRNSWVSEMFVRVNYVDGRKPSLREVYDAARVRYGDARRSNSQLNLDQKNCRVISNFCHKGT